MNLFANHGGSDVNAIEACKLQKPKHLKDTMTSRRFIFEALEEAGVVPLGGHKEDPCLMHPGACSNLASAPDRPSSIKLLAYIHKFSESPIPHDSLP